VVPQGDCTSGQGYEATWVGLGGYISSSASLEQTGTEFDCNADGTAKYSAWYELVPAAGHDISMTVKPGDTIDAAVTVKGSKVTLYLKNRTRGSSFRRTFTMKAPDTTTAEWIVEAPSECNGAGQCVQLPLSNFGTTIFRSASATSARGTHGSISSSRWKNTQVTLSQGGGPRRFAQYASARGAEPSALTAAGTSFSVAYSDQAPSSQSSPPMLSPGTAGA
jgi:Peptidase A4 family